jgi:hypothetical protein
VWPIEIPQISAQNLKNHPNSELGALEVKFGPISVGTLIEWGWLDAKFDSTLFQKKFARF